MQNETEEVWKDIPGFEGKYQASNLGRIKSLLYGKERIRKPGLSAQGYWNLGLGNGYGTKMTQRTVHSLIAETFLGPCPKDNDVRHLDGTRTNNNISNLAYGTRADNCQDTRDHGRMMVGITHYSTRLKEKDVLEIRRLYATGRLTAKSISRMFMVTVNAVWCILKRRNWKHIPEENLPDVLNPIPY